MPRLPLPLLLAAPALAALLAGCPSTPEAPDATPPIDCSGGLVAELRAPGGDYVPLAAAGDGVELVQGFQGFRYVYLRARLDVDPGDVPASVRIELDGTRPRAQPISQLVFEPDAAGSGYVTGAVQVFFNDDPLPSLVDQACALELSLADDCTDAGTVVLRYDPTCVEGPDGLPICEEAAR